MTPTQGVEGSGYHDGGVFELYKIALEEYRFEVKLNNDRTFRFLVLNAAALSVGTGLLKTNGLPASNIFVVLLFFAGAMTSVLGIRAIKKGHEYYRRAIYKKTLIETRLGLHHPLDDLKLAGVNTEYPGATLAIATTVGQSEINEILQHPESWIKRPLRTGTIMQAGVAVLWLLLAANILAAILSMLVVWRELSKGVSFL
jgi:hypothetical protein